MVVISIPLTSDIESKIIEYLSRELVDGDIKPEDVLGDVLGRASIGRNGAGLDFAGFIEETYGIPIGDSANSVSYRLNIKQVASGIVSELEKRVLEE
jgi:hypothetical protein